MKTKPVPTSPQYRPSPPSRSQAAAPHVWSPDALQQPAPVPAGAILRLGALVSLVMTALILVGLAWAMQTYPHSWLTRWVPVSATTVVEKVTESPNSTVPESVTTAAKSLYGLAVDQGQGGIYTASHIAGVAVPLSDNGWLVTLTAARPAGSAAIVALPGLGQPQPISLTLDDPASPFVFFKTTALNQPPATIASAEVVSSGQAVWVVNQALQETTIVSRRLLSATVGPWLAADRQERYWLLDGPTAALPGSAVLDQRGRFVGVLGEQNRVWPLTAIEPILKSLVQAGSLDRPWLGLTYLDQGRAVVTGQPTVSGLLIGAAAGNQAVAQKSPAEKAGLKAGDVLINLDGQPIGGDLFDLLGRYHPGDTITLTYQRQGKTKDVTVQLGVLRP